MNLVILSGRSFGVVRFPGFHNGWAGDSGDQLDRAPHLAALRPALPGTILSFLLEPALEPDSQQYP